MVALLGLRLHVDRGPTATTLAGTQERPPHFIDSTPCSARQIASLSFCGAWTRQGLPMTRARVAVVPAPALSMPRAIVGLETAKPFLNAKAAEAGTSAAPVDPALGRAVS